ncbi:unnamed protein product [Sphenostylis stenocarpa]|uniref:Uncharacterized protein n=1 Tax=Sphenostylis stenocarpa TaxID=92480 RepID=A0AA86RSK9_9FABA|nr:unnamed protein product [Sphenostylis stenocarpa]
MLKGMRVYTDMFVLDLLWQDTVQPIPSKKVDEYEELKVMSIGCPKSTKDWSEMAKSWQRLMAMFNLTKSTLKTQKDELTETTMLYGHTSYIQILASCQ